MHYPSCHDAHTEVAKYQMHGVYSTQQLKGNEELELEETDDTEDLSTKT